MLVLHDKSVLAQCTNVSEHLQFRVRGGDREGHVGGEDLQLGRSRRSHNRDEQSHDGLA